MEPIHIVLFVWLLLSNLAGFISMGMDKNKARRNQWRIRERTLFYIAMAGGSLGSLLGMKVFRHKTKHASFRIGIPLILVFHLGIICYLIYTKG